MKHIVILKKWALEKIISLDKIIESRWSINKTTPYQKLKNGDLLYLKETGKEVTHTAVVKDVKYYKLSDDLIKELLFLYGKDIGVDQSYYLKVKNKKYCTLIWLGEIKNIEPFKVKKSYGSGWLVI